jgi:hypothetical protein
MSTESVMEFVTGTGLVKVIEYIIDSDPGYWAKTNLFRRW